jgi:glycosyltransferase involved in cell wall biosynthesis
MKRIRMATGEAPSLVSKFEDQLFEISTVEADAVTGAFRSNKSHNRFEVQVTYADGALEWFSVLADLPYQGTAPDLLGVGCAFSFQLQEPFETISFEFKHTPSLNAILTRDGRLTKPGKASASKSNTVILFDVSDLVYYIGHHDNLTGIQRVQACVLLGLVKGHPEQRREYISYNNVSGEFNVIDREFFEALLIDLSLPVASRTCAFDPMEARRGILPQSYPLSDIRLEPAERLVVYLLGAAWVNRDYFHRILDLKRTYDAMFCITIHDLIPIYARETCDQGTAVVFEEFLRKSFLFADHYFAVSAHTAFDLHRYAASLGRTNVPVSVIENGHCFDEFIPPKRGGASEKDMRRLDRDGYVLFVSTIEGRKNHTYIFDVWQELSRTRPNLPVLLCVGRFGWRAEGFLEKMLMTDNLGNRIRVLSEISDAQLDALYAKCLFTVYPSTYEGWGLPAGESLSKGKLCAMSDRSSLPEVAGEFGVYFDVDSVDDGVAKISRLIDDLTYRQQLERDVQDRFVVRTWTKVAEELVDYVAKLPLPRNRAFPVFKIGQEYKLSQLPPRNITALGAAMISQVQGARRGPLSGYINRDEDLLAAQSSRFATGWCAPEDWGTWARYPDCSRLYYVRPDAGARELIVYERVRVVGALVGSTLSVSLNDAPAKDFIIEQERFLLRVSGPIERDPDGLAELSLRYRVHGPQGIAAKLDEIDGRRLGLGIESTLILQDSDIALRLTIIETALTGAALGLGRPRRIKTHERLPPSRRRKPATIEDAAEAPAEEDVYSTFAAERTLDAPKIEIGERVLFGQSNTLRSNLPAGSLLGHGWFPLEDEAVWSNSTQATVNFRLPAGVERVFMLAVEFRCIASPASPAALTVALNDVRVWSDIVAGSDFQHRRFIVDSAVSPYDNAFVAVLQTDRLMSPAQLDQGDDHRELGIQLRAMSLEAIPRLAPRVMHNVGNEGAAGLTLVNGWYPLEASGCWSMAEGGRIVTSIDGMTGAGQKSVRLMIEARVFGTARMGPASVDLVVQGQVLVNWCFEDDRVCQQTAILPLAEVGDRQLLDVTLVRRDGVSPADVSDSDDRRRLGVLLMGVRIGEVELFMDETDVSVGDHEMEAAT